MRYILTIFLCLFAFNLEASPTVLSVTADSHFLEDESGDTIFILGDTLWYWYAMTEAKMDEYLLDRYEKGFNAIFIRVDVDSLDADNNYPFGTSGGDWNPADPTATYFNHLEHFIHKAAEYDMYVFFICLWNFGNYEYDMSEGAAPDFHLFDDDAGGTTLTQDYATWLSGTRFATEKNIVWITVGDPGDSDSVDTYDINDWLSAGLVAGDALNRPISAHSGGGGDLTPAKTSMSAHYWGDDADFDFYTIQTNHGHTWMSQSYLAVDEDYNDPPQVESTGDPPLRPTFVMEPFYEDIPDGDGGPDCYAHQVRIQAWTGLLAGAFGVGLGVNGVWQAYGEPNGSSSNSPEEDWDVAMDLYYGQKQLCILRQVMEDRDWADGAWEPHQSMVIDSSGTCYSSLKSQCVFACNMDSGTTFTNDGTDNTFGNIGNMTEVNSVDFDEEGKEGKGSCDFENSDSDSLTQADGLSTDINGASDLTLCCWYKRENEVAATDDNLICKWGGGQNQYLLFVSDYGVGVDKFGFALNDGDTESEIGNTTVLTGTWYHVCATYDNTNNEMLIFVNGAVDGGAANPTDGNIATSTSAFTIGNVDGGGSPADGLIDEVLVDNSEFTATQIANLYASGVSSHGSGVNTAIDRVQCARRSDKHSAVCYVADGESVTLDMARMSGASDVYILNPRTGRSWVYADSVAASGSQTVNFPAQGLDWVVVIDAESESYPAP